MKRAMLFLLCIIVCFMGTGCGKNKEKEPNDGRMAVDERLEDMAVLKVYAVKDDETMTQLQSAFTLAMFATKQASMEIEWFENVETLNQTLTTELLGGGGPDVIFFYPSDFESFFSLLKNNIFEDLNPYLEDAGIRLDKMNEKALEAGVFNGKRMFLPLSYQVEIFETSDFAVNGFDFNGITTIEELVQRHDEYIRLKNGEAYNFYISMSLAEFLEQTGIPIIDYEKQSIEWNEEELKYYVDLYKKLSVYMIQDQSVYAEYPDPELGVITEGDVVFINQPYYISPRMVKYASSLMKTLAGKETANYYSISDLAGYGTTAYATYSVAINRNSKHKEEAALLINTILDKDMQMYGQNIMYPILNNTMKNLMDNLTLKEKGNLWFSRDTKIIAFTQEEKDYYESLVSNIEHPIWVDYRTRTLINESFEDYLTDKKDWNTTIKKVTSALRMYLSE